MKIVPFVAILVVAGFVKIQARPAVEPEKKETKNANIYVLGDISNAAISNEKSKAQAASDRNESEWNNTEMLNGVSNYPSEPTFRETRGGDILIYSGGDAANLAISYDGSESQAAENDQKSGYNNQNLGMGTSEGVDDDEEFDEERK